MLDPESSEFRAAYNLWTKGKGHLFGVIALESASRAYANEHEVPDVEQFVFSGHFSVSLHLLLGFAAELLIKSAYILHGGDPKFVRKFDVGHDLIKLLDAAEEQGFVANDRHTRDIFEYLWTPHLNHQFRYGNEEEVPMPDLFHTIPALQILSEQVQDLIEAAA